MQNLKGRIEELDSKVRQVLQKMELIRQENKTLIAENIKLKKDLEDTRMELGQMSIHNVSAESMNQEVIELEGGSQSEFLKGEIDRYVAEIDECIGLLKAQ